MPASPSPRSVRLEEAAGAARRGEWAGVLEALRAAWLEGAHPLLSALARQALERLHERPVTAVRERELEAAWLALAESKAPQVLPRLVLTPWPRLPRDARARVVALQSMPRDVLVGVAVSELVRTDPYRSAQGGAAIRRALRGLFSARDPLAPVLLSELGQRYEYLLDAVRRLTPTAPVELDAREAALVAQLEQALGGPTDGLALRAQLLQEVLARPRDDGPRAVLADVLTEAGDARGEFISLQLARAAGRGTDKSSRREKGLVRTHGLTWLGALRPYVSDEPARLAAAFSRGFVARARLRAGLDASIFSRTPEWATVEALSLCPGLVFDFHEHLRSLSSLHHLVSTTAAAIPPLREASVDVRAQLARLPLTEVHTLGLQASFGAPRAVVDEALAAARRTRWFDSVRHLRLPGGVRELRWASELLDATPALESVELTFELMGELGYPSQWGATLERAGALRVVWEGRNWSGPPVEDVAAALAQAPLGRLQRVVVDERAKLTSEQRASVEAAIDEALSGWPAGLALEVFGRARGPGA